jgi:hypothetical protein
MKDFNALRTLARSNYWQIVYSRSKEMAQVSLFENQTDFTPLQCAFFQWLEIYHSLEIDLASNKPHISREVIEDDIRCDAYLRYREIISKMTEKEVSELEKNDTGRVDGSLVFTSGK